jgi:hypothetical protein
MGAAATFVTTILLPALIASILYLLLSVVLIPLWQRYRGRYSRYLPLEAISAQTSTIRERVQDAVGRWILPSRWRQNFDASRFAVNATVSEHEFDEDDGEELYELDGNRREALSLDARRRQEVDGARLSRDLEEGFADDSDEDAADGRATTSRRD